jgi:tol-pal system protein YbgF
MGGTMSRIFIFLFTGILLASMTFSCGSSRKDDEETAAGDSTGRKQELDEIESLLGITPQEKQKADQPKKSKKEEDTLGLLDAGAVPMGEETSQVDQKKLNDAQTEITSLKSQIDKKDLLINDLKAQVRNQSDQIYQLETQKKAAPAQSTYTVQTGDVAPGEYQEKYQDALDMFHSHDYKQASTVFESLLASDANNSLADNAQYWIGECSYAMRQYKKAVIDFEKVFTFPKSNKNDAAQFKLGLCYMKLGDSQKAREEFQRLLDVYPRSEYTKRAQEHLATLSN